MRLATPSNYRPELAPAQAPCQCQGARSLGAIDAGSLFSDWKTWALIAAAVIVLFVLFQNSPQKQERAVELRKARARYRAQVRRIREEYA
jgi:hypothetical protein